MAFRKPFAKAALPSGRAPFCPSTFTWSSPATRTKSNKSAICSKAKQPRHSAAESIHPLAVFDDRGKPPSPWAAKQWKVYLDSEEAIEAAIGYVEANPEKEGKPRQTWSFVTRFAGIQNSGWVTYH